MARKIYTQDERCAALAALRANNNCIKQTARQVGIPACTLIRWRREATEHPPEKLDAATEEFAKTLKEVAHKILGHMKDDDRLKKTGIKDLAIAFGIVMDKLDLLTDGDQTDAQILSLIDAIKGTRQ